MLVCFDHHSSSLFWQPHLHPFKVSASLCQTPFSFFVFCHIEITFFKLISWDELILLSVSQSTRLDLVWKQLNNHNDIDPVQKNTFNLFQTSAGVSSGHTDGSFGIFQLIFENHSAEWWVGWQPQLLSHINHRDWRDSEEKQQADAELSQSSDHQSFNWANGVRSSLAHVWTWNDGCPDNHR